MVRNGLSYRYPTEQNYVSWLGSPSLPWCMVVLSSRFLLESGLGGVLPLSGGPLGAAQSSLSLVSISDSGFGIMSLSCSGVKLPVGGLLEELGGLCRGCSAASRWMALDSGRSCVPHFFVDYLPRVPTLVMSGLHVWWSGRPLFFYISNLHKNK